DPGYQLERRRNARQKTEQHERLVERRLVRIRRPEASLEARRLGAEHMVEREHMVVPELLRRLRVVPDRCRIVADLRLRKHHAELHVSSCTLTRMTSAPPSTRRRSLRRSLGSVQLQPPQRTCRSWRSSKRRAAGCCARSPRRTKRSLPPRC